MTTPNGFAAHLAGDYTDFLKCKANYTAPIPQAFSLSVADNATAGTVYGVMAFRKGASLIPAACTIYTPDLDTDSNVTWNVGYVYDDNTNNTNDADAYGSALSGQSAGLLTLDEEEGIDIVATADGYYTLTLAAGPVTTAGTVEGQLLVSYNGG